MFDDLVVMICELFIDILKWLFKCRSFRWLSYTFLRPSEFMILKVQIPPLLPILPLAWRGGESLCNVHSSFPPIHMVGPSPFHFTSKLSSKLPKRPHILGAWYLGYFGGAVGWEISKALYFQWVLMSTSSPTKPEKIFWTTSPSGTWP